MELGLFTRGAYIWPVYRNFEAFIASLGVPGSDTTQLADCPLYPVRIQTDSAAHGLAADLDQRLSILHRNLYDALLRPVESFSREPRSFADYFVADLRGTTPADLLDAFMFFFIRQSTAEIPVVTGLAVLRGVFFSHESVEPALWLHGSINRVAAERRPLPERSIRFTAPSESKLSDLAFCIVTTRNRPPGGSGWITGRARRELDGHCQVTADFGLDPALAGSILPAGIAAQLDGEVRAALAHVFGWQQAVAL